jgi:hypothetical protein
MQSPNGYGMKQLYSSSGSKVSSRPGAGEWLWAVSPGGWQAIAALLHCGIAWWKAAVMQTQQQQLDTKSPQ